MKNLPRVPRPPRSVSSYARRRKTSHIYPSWVTEGREPPPQIQAELTRARRFAAEWVERQLAEMPELEDAA